jgi:hypothetical protein
LEGTFSQGIISAIRNIGGVAFLQMTAPISPGSSGGPLLDSEGRVVGIVTSTMAGQNVNFAIPSHRLSVLLREPRNSRSTASITSGEIPGVVIVHNVEISSSKWKSSVRKDVTKIKGTKIRNDVALAEPHSDIVDVVTGRMIRLNHSTRTFMVFDSHHYNAGSRPKYTATGKTATIAGMEAKEYTATGAGVSYSVWIAIDLPDHAITRALMDFHKAVSAQLIGGDFPIGLPLRTTFYLDSERHSVTWVLGSNGAEK